MIKFTPKQHQDSLKTKSVETRHRVPSELTIKFIMGYGAALQVKKSKNVGQFDILLN
mgnify:CR=1 FL=1